MGDEQLAFASIGEIGKLFRTWKLSPVELTQLILERIQRINPKINAYLTVCEESARQQAKLAEAAFGRKGRSKSKKDPGPLSGIPISLKDNIYTKDIRTTGGSQILR